MGRRRIGQGHLALVALCALVASTCSDRGAAIPGLDPNDEVELVEIEPAPGDESYVWAHAYELEGAPPVNVGHPTAEFLEAGARVEDDPSLYLCFGDERGVAGVCEVEDPDRPAIVGLTFGTSDVHAWTWAFVPEEVAAVQFTDQEGRTTWQRPRDRVVIFPDTVEADSDGDCACQLDAMTADGAVIDSFDLETSSSLGRDD